MLYDVVPENLLRNSLTCERKSFLCSLLRQSEEEREEGGRGKNDNNRKENRRIVKNAFVLFFFFLLWLLLLLLLLPLSVFSNTCYRIVVGCDMSQLTFFFSSLATCSSLFFS